MYIFLSKPLIHFLTQNAASCMILMYQTLRNFLCLLQFSSHYLCPSRDVYNYPCHMHVDWNPLTSSFYLHIGLLHLSALMNIPTLTEFLREPIPVFVHIGKGEPKSSAFCIGANILMRKT